MGNRLQDRPATIRDIAREAGVSVATISRVLNGRAHVAPDTREAVLRVVRERGFSRNPMARALPGGRTGLVGLTLPLIHAPYFATLTSSIADALSDYDMRAVLCPTRHRRDRELSLLERTLRGTTDGTILILPSEPSTELVALLDRGYRLVVLDPMKPLDASISCISASNASGAHAATQHLLDLGHRRIAAITGPAGWCATEERLAGYRAALAGAGLLPDPVLEAEADFEVLGGRREAGRLLDLPEPPTAIFAFNDNLALGAIEVARARGLRVPHDLSVIGFDDSDLAPAVTPALASVRQPLGEMGRMAVRLLLRQIEEQAVEPLQVELATSLVVRASTAPPPVGAAASARS